MTIFHQVIILFLVSIVSAFPVTIGFRKLYRVARKTAVVVWVFVAPISAYAVLVGGLLGFPGIFIYVQVAGLPVWLLLGIVTLARRIRNRPKKNEKHESKNYESYIT